MTIASAGWWTSNHVLVITNIVLAVATIATALVAIFTIRASNRVASAAESQSKATADQVELGSEQVRLGAEQLAQGAKQLEQDKQALQATIRPLIVDVPLGIYSDDVPGMRMGTRDLGLVSWAIESSNQSFWVRVPFRNIGSGPAFIRETLFTCGPSQVWSGEVNRRVLPAGELGTATLSVYVEDHLHGALSQAFQGMIGRLAVAIKYSDLSGDQRSQSVIYVEQRRNAQGRVTNLGVSTVAIYGCDPMWVRDTDPVNMTGSAVLPW